MKHNFPAHETWGEENPHHAVHHVPMHGLTKHHPGGQQKTLEKLLDSVKKLTHTGPSAHHASKAHEGKDKKDEHHTDTNKHHETSHSKSINTETKQPIQSLKPKKIE